MVEKLLRAFLKNQYIYNSKQYVTNLDILKVTIIWSSAIRNAINIIVIWMQGHNKLKKYEGFCKFQEKLTLH